MADKPSEVWLRTDEIMEMIGAIEHSREIAPTVCGDVMRWKWLFIALHNALQGACVCALRGAGASDAAVLSSASAKAWWKWLDVDSRNDNSLAPKDARWLARMLELYDRAKSPAYLQEPHRLQPHAQMDCDVKKLNDLRNDFLHFVPEGWSLDVSGMPRIVRNCCEAFEHLAVKQPTFLRHLDDAKSARIATAISGIRDAMDAWDGQWARS
jgi:hypothetical protein